MSRATWRRLHRMILVHICIRLPDSGSYKLSFCTNTVCAVYCPQQNHGILTGVYANSAVRHLDTSRQCNLCKLDASPENQHVAQQFDVASQLYIAEQALGHHKPSGNINMH